MGFDVDMAKALAHEMDVSVTFVDAEWQRLLGGLSKGDFAMRLTCMSKSGARGANVSDAHDRLAEVIVVKKTNSTTQALEDLTGKVVGVQIGSGSLKGRFKSIKRYNFNPEAFDDLKFGRIDAVLVGYAFAVHQNKVSPIYKVVGAPLAEAEIVAVMKKGAEP